MSSNKIFNSAWEEDRWVLHIDNMFGKLDTTKLKDYPVCIYHVPKSLSSANPEAFLPQIVALGPYHHFRPELYPMEMLKLTAAKRVFENLITLKQLVDKLRPLAPYVRASFHKYIDLKNDTLMRIMAIDTIFLKDFLRNENLMRDLVRTGGLKLTMDAIIRDVMMLENQIPMCMLRKILEVQRSRDSEGSINEELGLMLNSFCSRALKILPFERTFSNSEAATRTHLLDLLYQMILPPQQNPPPSTMSRGDGIDKANDNNDNNVPCSRCLNAIDTVLCCFKNLKKLSAKVSKFLEALTKYVGNLGFLQAFTQRLRSVLDLCQRTRVSGDPESSPESDGPVVVMIPSVTELHDAGIHFKPLDQGGISKIRFDNKTRTLHLPKIRLDVNTEVIIRNLVAYEAMTKSESLLFTRYSELMRAIIDTVEDVELLVKRKIIVNKLSKKEAEQLFNGMSKSIGPTKTEDLDREIEKVNKCFNNTDKVRAYRVMAKYVYSSWKLFTLLATLVLLGLMALQTFCSAYDCPSNLRSAGGKGTS